MSGDVKESIIQPSSPVQLISPATPPQQPAVHFQQINLTNIEPTILLPASEIQALAVINPSWPDRIMAMTEATLAHNRSLQLEQLAQSRMVIESQARANELNAEAQKQGMARLQRTDWMGFLLVLTALVSGIWVLFRYHDATILNAFFGGIAAIASVLWIRRKMHHKD